VQPLDHIGVVRSDAIIFWALLASGQINMRIGWQTLATAPIDQPIDLAP
jgi:putative transposase